MLTFTQKESAFLKESYTINSTSSYSYSETSANTVQEHTVSNDISNSSSASATTNDQVQGRKVSSLKITPVTIPDPPDHINSYLEPQPKSQTTSSPPPAFPPPQKGRTLSQPPTQTATLSVHLSPESQKNPEPRPPNPAAALKVPDQAPNPSPRPAASQVETSKAPPAIPPRPSPAELLVHNWLHTETTEHRSNDCV